MVPSIKLVLFMNLANFNFRKTLTDERKSRSNLEIPQIKISRENSKKAILGQQQKIAPIKQQKAKKKKAKVKRMTNDRLGEDKVKKTKKESVMLLFAIVIEKKNYETFFFKKGLPNQIGKWSKRNLGTKSGTDSESFINVDESKQDIKKTDGMSIEQKGV